MAQLKSTTVSGRLDVSDKVNTPKINATEMYTLNNVNLLDVFYPVGSIYMSTTQVESTKNTVNKYGCPIANLGGKWERVQGRFLAAYGSNGEDGNKGLNLDTAGAVGGESNHLLAVNELPEHKHEIPSHSHSVNMWLNDHSGTGYIDDSGQGGGQYFANTTEISINAAPATKTNAGTYNNSGAKQTEVAHNNLPPYLVVYMWKRIAD